MTKEKIQVVTDLPRPSVLKRFPVKKVAVAAAAVAVTAVAAKFVKDHVSVDVETIETPEA